MVSKSTVKYIQSLQHKKFRDEYSVFIAEGPKVVSEMLAEKIFDCEEIFCLEQTAPGLMEMLRSDESVTFTIIKDFELEKISALATPNSVLAVFKKRPQEEKPDLAGNISLALDDVQDPGNLGTIIRTADWFGIQHILCSNATADCFSPKVVQSTMASLGRVNIIYGELEHLLPAGIKKYAAVPGAADISSAGKITEGIIIIGNESKGISENILRLADQQLSIAKKGKAESLNAAVAAAIILFAVTR